MNTQIGIAWILTALLAILSVTLLMGKGAILIAGYNTSSPEQKAKYNAKKLCRVMGGGLSLLTIFSGILAFYKLELPYFLSWIIPWGLLGVIALMLVLGNTICKSKG